MPFDKLEPEHELFRFLSEEPPDWWKNLLKDPDIWADVRKDNYINVSGSAG